MTEIVTAELRLLKKAEEFVNTKGSSDNPKIAKLFRRVAADPLLWTETYRLMFSDLAWASEMTILGLNREEVAAVAAMLRAMKIEGIQLNSPEGYKALGLSGVQKLREKVHLEFQSVKKSVEDETKALLRFDRRGIVASGYKRGYPLTSYISQENFYHKLYLDNEGRFQMIDRALEARLPRDNELFLRVIAVEKSVPAIRKAWEIWKREQFINTRISNIEKFSDAQGAFA